MSKEDCLLRQEITEFYREEFLKHKARLRMQKEFYSEEAFNDIEEALDKIISEIDTICRVDRFNELASHLLERIDIITHLSSSPCNHSERIH